MLSAVNGWTITEWTGAIIGIITATGLTWRKVVVPVRGFVRGFKAWMSRIEAATLWTEQQMKPNGGASVVDKVDRLQRDVEMLLRHDAERDRHGMRYGDDKTDNQGGTPT